MLEELDLLQVLAGLVKLVKYQKHVLVLEVVRNLLLEVRAQRLSHKLDQIEAPAVFLLLLHHISHVEVENPVLEKLAS